MKNNQYQRNSMDSTTDSIIKRIKKLLTLANNSGATEAEAKNAMAMAQRLMTKYNISMANVGAISRRNETFATSNILQERAVSIPQTRKLR